MGGLLQLNGISENERCENELVGGGFLLGPKEGPVFSFIRELWYDSYETHLQTMYRRRILGTGRDS